MDRFETGQRPLWLDALIGLGIGGGRPTADLRRTGRGAGWDGPVVTILAPTAVGHRGGDGRSVGLGSARDDRRDGRHPTGPPQSVDPAFTVPATLDLVVSLGAGLFGYGIGWAIVQQASVPYMMRPPAAADLARVEAETRTQLRGIDPQAPGSFEKATVLLRAVNEQVSSYSMWGGPRPTGEASVASTGLLDLQAELVETARVAAMAAGARRVTITSSGMGGGIDVQAVFGDPIGIDEQQPPTALDVD